MIQIEKTIVTEAQRYLQQMHSLADSARGSDDMCMLVNAYRDLSTLTVLAMIQDSGLSDEAVSQLHEVERKANGIVARINSATVAE